MPTYQYACTECGDQTEVVQRFSDDPLTVCGACGGKLRSGRDFGEIANTFGSIGGDDEVRLASFSRQLR